MLLAVGKTPVLVSVQPSENGPIRRLPVPIFKDADTEMIRVRGPQLLRQLHFGMAKIVMTNESADETNDDQAGGTTGGGRQNRLQG